MKKALVVDNNEVILKILSHTLQTRGLQVQTAKDGLSALQTLEHYRPDIIFTDLIMPNIDGENLCRIISGRKDLSATLLIVVSAIAVEGNLDFLDFGAHACIAKGPASKMRESIDLILSHVKNGQIDLLKGKLLGAEDLVPRTVAKELIEAKHHYKLIFDNIDNGILEFADSGIIVNCNSYLTRFLDRKVLDIISLNIRDLFPEDTQRHVNECLDRFLNTRRPVESTRSTHVNNKDIVFKLIRVSEGNNSTSIMIIKDMSEELSIRRQLKKHLKQLEEIVAAKTKSYEDANIELEKEITERKQTEEALRNSERFLRSTVDVLTDHITVLDDRGEIILTNKAYRDFAAENGIDPRTVSEGANYLAVCDTASGEHSEEATPFAEGIREVLSGKCRSFKLEYPCHSPDEKRWFVAHVTPFDEDGPRQVIVGHQNITERKQAEDERLKLEAQLQQSQKMESIGTLAGGIAHEFNNMLAIIMGNNELIMEELPHGSLAKESTEEIRIAGLRARDVVKQLLTFSRQNDAVKRVMDFKFVVHESMKLIRSSTPANIKIEQNLSADTYPVMGNETQINQLLINLCNNAVDALPEKGGTISIELLNATIDIQQTKHQKKLNPGQYAKLMVSDNGIGMDTAILDRVFEPYFTTKNIGEGTGIGMAVVHGIVERHGGAIAVDSKPGQGTTFTIFFPAHEGLLEQETEDQDILPVGDECILYVDDEPSLATLGKRLLERFGYTAVSITDPVKALDMVRADPNKFDLLITDMAMPNMTGEQLVIETLKIRPNMPIIICTGYSAKISKKEAADIGVRSFIMKPINKSELAKMVRKVLDGAKGDDFVKS